MFCFPQSWQSHLKLPAQTKGKQSFGPAEGQAVLLQHLIRNASLDHIYVPWLLQILFIRAEVLFTNWTLPTTIIVLQVAIVTAKLCTSEQEKDVQNVSSPKKVAQAQAQDPHICQVKDRLSLISTNERNPLIRSCGGRWICRRSMLKILIWALRREQRMNERQVELPTGQSQRPVYTRKPLNCYVKWILNSLQHKSDHLKMLEDKEPITTLKPKLLKRARILQGNCSFFQWVKLSRVFVNRLIWFLLLEVTVKRFLPLGRE